MELFNNLKQTYQTKASNYKNKMISIYNENFEHSYNMGELEREEFRKKAILDTILMFSVAAILIYILG